MEIYLIRHTSVDIDKGVCYGHSDVFLKSTYSKELGEIKDLLQGDFDVIYTSPLIRCKQAASDLASYLGDLEVRPDSRLKEMNFGAWELQRWEDINLQEIQPWYDDFVNQRAKEGESFLDLNQRVVEFIKALKSQNYKRVILVTHAGVIRCFLNHFYNIPLEKTFDVKIDYASVVQINL
ncbi:alpha-ribazole phosphatase [Myroides sp. LJL110]